MTDWKALIAARPSGATAAALIAAYGNPEGPGAGPSPQGGAWFTPSPAWARENLTTIPAEKLPHWPLLGGKAVSGVTVHRQVAAPLIATWAEVNRRGLAGRLRTFNGAAAFRHMGHDRSRPLSVHAFGAAVDVDAAWNAYGVPPAQMQIDRDVVRVFQECGWEWGGLWSDPYEDGMHFQWTDPLPGVRQPAWRDAMARGEGRAPKPTPAPAPAPATGIVVKPTVQVPVVLVPDGRDEKGRPKWRDVTGERATLPGGTVVNATDPTRIWIAER